MRNETPRLVALLHGMYSPLSPFYLLRGTPALLQQIWVHVRDAEPVLVQAARVTGDVLRFLDSPFGEEMLELAMPMLTRALQSDHLELLLPTLGTWQWLYCYTKKSSYVPMYTPRAELSERDLRPCHHEPAAAQYADTAAVIYPLLVELLARMLSSSARFERPCAIAIRCIDTLITEDAIQ